LFDEIEYKAKRLAADRARLNANGTAVANAAQEEFVDCGSICKPSLGMHHVSFIIVNHKNITKFFSRFLPIKYNILHRKNHC